MSKILFIVSPENFRDEELFKPMEVLKEENTLYVASLGVKTAKGLKNGVVPVDFNLSDVDASKFDAVVFVGGGGAKIYFEDPVVHRIAIDAYAKGKILAAICVAPSILANAGLLRGIKVTAFPSEELNLKEKGAAFVHENVVIDGKFITANGPHVAHKFGEAIKSALKEEATVLKK